MAQEMLEHPEKKGSTGLWFILAFIPIANIFVMWKAAEEVAGHEVITEKHQSLAHMKPKDSTIKWFGIFLLPAIIGAIGAAIVAIMAGPSIGGTFYYSTATTGMPPGMQYIWVLMIPSFIIGLYILYKMAGVVSGHDKVYETHERLEHLDSKESTGKWMVFGIIPILNLYFLWKVAEAISGHESMYD